MAKGTFQSIIVVGNLGQDPDIRATASGTQVANMSIGVTDYAGKDQQGQAQHSVEWFKCVVFGAQAEAMANYAMKGTKVQVQGRMKTRKWTDQQGVDHYSTELVANEVNILAKGRPPIQGQGGYQPQGGAGNQPTQGFGQPAQGFGNAGNTGAPAQQRTTAPSPAPGGAPSGGDEWMDEDSIPF